jgi:hypothetical protein
MEQRRQAIILSQPFTKRQLYYIHSNCAGRNRFRVFSLSIGHTFIHELDRNVGRSDALDSGAGWSSYLQQSTKPFYIKQVISADVTTAEPRFM